MQRAAFAQSNLDSTSGSAARVQEQSNDNAQVDALMARYEGEIRARGYTGQANQEAYQGEVSRYNAGMARRSGNIGMAAALLSSASDVAGRALKVG